jgi:hypothetical protein
VSPFGITLVLMALAFICVVVWRSTDTTTTSARGFVAPSPVAPAPTAPAAPLPDRPDYTEQPLPIHGEAHDYTTARHVAPLEISGLAEAHSLVKIVDVLDPRRYVTVFVHKGMTTKVRLPLGSYELRYAMGDAWYGYEHLFGPDTTYTKADTQLDFRVDGDRVSGYSVTLYKVRDGNLETSSIPPTAF